MNDHIIALEEQLAHLTRALEDLSEVVARQDREIETLKKRLARLVEREAERDVAEGANIPLADQRPPHW